MPRIRQIDKLYEVCSQIRPSRYFTRQLGNLKAGDYVENDPCDSIPSFIGRVIGFMDRGYGTRYNGSGYLCLVHVPNLPSDLVVCWGKDVLSLEADKFKKVEVNNATYKKT